jgi:hypothetical protein
MRCAIAFWRLMSTMNAMRGLNATRYVKFCSGPTPMYALVGLIRDSSAGITCCSAVSLETKLLDLKNPSSSDIPVNMLQNVVSAICSGRLPMTRTRPGRVAMTPTIIPAMMAGMRTRSTRRPGEAKTAKGNIEG